MESGEIFKLFSVRNLSLSKNETHPPRSREAAEALASSLLLRLVDFSRAHGLLMPTDTKLGGADSVDFGAGFSLTIKPAVRTAVVVERRKNRHTNNKNQHKKGRTEGGEDFRKAIARSQLPQITIHMEGGGGCNHALCAEQPPRLQHVTFRIEFQITGYFQVCFCLHFFNFCTKYYYYY